LPNEHDSRIPPEGMPAQAPRPDRSALHGKAKPADALPSQQPITDEEIAEKRPSAVKRLLIRIGAAVMAVIALIFAYVFLLLGEPDEDAKYMTPPVEESITMPMSPFEAPGASSVENLADTFGGSVLSFYSGPAMIKARVYDTALGGGYARRATLTYAFEDGTQLTAESLRPTSAVALLKAEGAMLDATALYTLGGLNAGRMDTKEQICVFAQSDTAVYAVLCPSSHADELEAILKQTTLVAPGEN